MSVDQSPSARINVHYTERRLKAGLQQNKLHEAALKAITPIVRALNISCAEVLACSNVNFSIIQELQEACQNRGWLTGVRAVVAKHKDKRHENELQGIEDLLGDLRVHGAVFIYTLKDDKFLLLPLTSS
jgi:hypothetical protein